MCPRCRRSQMGVASRHKRSLIVKPGPPYPTLRKQSISQYLTTECDRQLALEMWRKCPESQEMPPRHVARPGLEIIAREGRDWELKKVSDLASAFPEGILVGNPLHDANGQVSGWSPMALQEALQQALPGSFLVEAEYTIGETFITAHSLDSTFPLLSFSDLRPDLIQVIPSSRVTHMVDPKGEVVEVAEDDQRLGLRVIDIKLAAQPTTGHFVEVAYYACALSAWLEDAGLADFYVVVDNAALWPGSHEASAVLDASREAQEEGRTLTDNERLDALEEDLEEVPLEVMSLRLRRFFEVDLLRVNSKPWYLLDWHVDGRCRNCDWLGQQWTPEDVPTWHQDHCMPTAKENDHLSRVAFMPRGAAASLQERGVETVSNLAGYDSNASVFDDHQSLRIGRGVLAGRAQALVTSEAGIPPGTGTSALMPRWVDLRIRISVDFDIGSGISIAFAAEANWMQPFRHGRERRERHRYPFRRFTVEERSLDTEKDRLVAFLRFVGEVLDDAQRRDEGTTYQVFIWDQVQYEHFVRVIGRHLPTLLADRQLRNLVWLFPPEEVAPNPSLQTRNSPICIVRDVVRAVVGAPLPHYYSMLALARVYWPDWVNDAPTLNVHPLFEDPLSDQIPSERAHEIWSRSTGRRDWQETVDQLTQALRVRLLAMRFIVDRLGQDLRETLKARAPQISLDILPPGMQTRVSFDGQLWYAFARLNAALEELEIHNHRSQPVYEREARFIAARLVRRLHGSEADAALHTLGLPGRPRRLVYVLAGASREIKAKEGDFGWSLSPESDPHFLDRSVWLTCRDHGLAGQVPNFLRRARMDRVTEVTIVGLDRDESLIAVDIGTFPPVAALVDALTRENVLDLEENVVLDRRPLDFFTPRLLSTLQAIGNPQVAANNANPSVIRAMGMENRRGARRTGHSPVAEALWDAHALATAQSQLQLRPEDVLSICQEAGIALNPSQQRALQRACSKRLSLIWGPPGTGKSRTLRAIVVGATLASRPKPLRVLICGPTYTSTDNVLQPVLKDLSEKTHNIVCARVRSGARTGENIDPSIDFPLSRHAPDPKVLELRERLETRAGPTIVSTVPLQVHNLLSLEDNDPVGELFDLIVIDEASQLDVANAVLATAALAQSGTVVVAGDHLQLPPIHKATPPLNLEHMVGSVYDYFHQHHRIEPVMLDINYRSNRTIVDFIKTAGYGTELEAHRPTLTLSTTAPLDIQPPSWPADITWSPGLAGLANPTNPISCFVYPEGRSSQWNHFEAETTAALVRLYWQRVTSLTQEERSPQATAMNATTFFEEGIGVVTPHRAQQSLIISYLHRAFQNIPSVTAELIRGSVDTVERFQGQERDIVITSFALGDPDAISDEDEFLLNLNRFNVISSRARAKLIVLVTDQVAIHLSKDPGVLKGSALLKRLVFSYCDDDAGLNLDHTTPTGATLTVSGRHRTKRLL